MADLTDVPGFDASNPDQVRQREREAQRRETETRNVLLKLLSDRPGRAWVLSLLESCHIYHTSFRSDPLQMAFSEGQRDIGLLLLAQVNRASPESIVLMMRERTESQNG